jgi:O-antigen ligase
VESCPEEGKETGVAIDGEILPLHPHNAVLQVWLELGGVGVLLGFGALAFTLGAAFRAPDLAHRVSRAVLAAGAAAGISVALISFGIWQEWWIASLGLLAAALAGAARLAAAPPWREQD